MTDPATFMDDDDLLAAEYALGVLDAETHAQARARVLSDPAFAAAVVAWEMRLSAMADLPAIAPPRAAKAALMGRLFAQDTPPFWQRLRVWQGLAGAALAAAVALAVLVWQPATTSGTGPLYTAEIVSEAGDFRVVAVVDKTSNEVILTRTAGAAPAGRILQVWAHGPDAPAESVGLWPEGDSVRLPLPPRIAAVQGTLTLGVSEEPPGGSPTGSPSGRVFGTVDIADVQRQL